VSISRIVTAFGVLPAGVLSITLAAQPKPDFSGQWTSAPAPAAVGEGGQRGARGGGRGARSGDMGSGWGSPLTITQDEARLTVEYVFFARGDLQPPLRFVYNLDGTETTNAVTMGRGLQEQRSTAAWQGSTLVITTAFPFTNPDTGEPMTSQVMQRLTLESPTSLVVEATRIGVLGGPSSTSRTVYRKVG